LHFTGNVNISFVVETPKNHEHDAMIQVRLEFWIKSHYYRLITVTHCCFSIRSGFPLA